MLDLSRKIEVLTIARASIARPDGWLMGLSGNMQDPGAAHCATGAIGMELGLGKYIHYTESVLEWEILPHKEKEYNAVCALVDEVCGEFVADIPELFTKRYSAAWRGRRQTNIGKVQFFNDYGGNWDRIVVEDQDINSKHVLKIFDDCIARLKKQQKSIFGAKESSIPGSWDKISWKPVALAASVLMAMTMFFGCACDEKGVTLGKQQSELPATDTPMPDNKHL